MTEPPSYRLENVERRVDRLEEHGAGPDHEKRLQSLEKYNLGVIVNQIEGVREEIRKLRADVDRYVRELRDDVDRDVGSLRRGFYTLAFGAISAAVVFAFSVFELLGR